MNQKEALVDRHFGAVDVDRDPLTVLVEQGRRELGACTGLLPAARGRVRRDRIVSALSRIRSIGR